MHPDFIAMPKNVRTAFLLGLLAFTLLLLALALRMPVIGLGALAALLGAFYAWDQHSGIESGHHDDLPVFEPRISAEQAESLGLKIVQAETLVTPARETVAAYAATKNIRIVDTLVRLMPEVYADVFAARRVLSVLLYRALEETPYGGEVIIHTEEDKDDMLFTVEDQGPGFQESDWLSWALKPWKSGINGVNMNFSELEQLVASQQGSLVIASEPGKGTSVTLVLPKANVLDD